MAHRLIPPKFQSNTDDKNENHATPHDPQFLQRLKAGDQEAWSTLYDEWSPRLFNYLMYNTRNQDDAKDVLSETMFGLIQAIPTFDGNVTLNTFIYSIACRKVADYWRRSRKTYELPSWLSISGPTSTRLEVDEALEELSEQGQQALLLRYREGLTVAEVADVLGRSYKATESLLSRVRRQFQHAFAGAEAYNGR